MASSDCEIIEMESENTSKGDPMPRFEEKSPQPSTSTPVTKRKEKVKRWEDEAREAGLEGYTPTEAAIAALKKASFQELPEPDKVICNSVCFCHFGWPKGMLQGQNSRNWFGRYYAKLMPNTCFHVEETLILQL